MLNDPKEYATTLLGCFYGDKEAALTELYNAARQDKSAPPVFWRAVAKEIERMGEEH